MSKSRLLLNMLGYGSYLGLGWGIVLGIAYYLIVFQFSLSVNLLYAALLGAICGVFLGGINGIVLCVLSLKPRSKIAFVAVAVLTTLICSLILFTFIGSLYVAAQQSISVFLPSILATVVAGYLSQSMHTYVGKVTQTQYAT